MKTSTTESCLLWEIVNDAMIHAPMTSSTVTMECASSVLQEVSMNYRKKFIEDMDKHTKNDRIKTLYDKEMHDGKFGVIEYCPRGDNSRVTIWVYDSGTWQMSRREYTDEINGRRMYGRIDTAEKAEGELGPSDAP